MQAHLPLPPGKRKLEHLEGWRERGLNEKQSTVCPLPDFASISGATDSLRGPSAKGGARGMRSHQSREGKIEEAPSLTQVFLQVWCEAHFKRNSKSLPFPMASESVFQAPHTYGLTVCLLTSDTLVLYFKDSFITRQSLPGQSCPFSLSLPTPSLWWQRPDLTPTTLPQSTILRASK